MHILDHMPHMRAVFLYFMYMDSGRKTCALHLFLYPILHRSDTVDVNDTARSHVFKCRGSMVIASKCPITTRSYVPSRSPRQSPSEGVMLPDNLFALIDRTRYPKATGFISIA